MAGPKSVNIVVSALLTLMILPCLPVLFLCFILPVLIVRQVVIFLRRCMVPDSGKILSPLSAFFAADRMYSDYPLSTNLINIIIEGNVPYERVRTALVENVLRKRDLITKELVYPELQQKVVAWGGFNFWETDKAFQVDNHIRLVTFPGYENKPVPAEVYSPFLKSLLKEPFSPDRSPWEVIVIHNYQDVWEKTDDARTLLVYRIHHALSGGYSSMNLLLDHGGVTAARSTARFPRIPFWKKILWNLVYIVRGPFEIVYNLVEAVDLNDWKLPANKLKQAKSAGVSRPIPIQVVKDVKNLHGVSFSAVISAAIAGGIRDYMMAKRIRVPGSIHVMTPWPVKDIPAKLGNFLTGVILEYPIGDPDPVARMHKIQKNFIKMKYSTVATTNYYLLKIMGRMFYSLLRPAHQNLMATTIMSNIAGPNEQQICFGHPIKDMLFVANFMCANVALGFTVLSYNGHVKMVCGGDEAILPRDTDAEELMEKIVLQFKILQKSPPIAKSDSQHGEKV